MKDIPLLLYSKLIRLSLVYVNPTVFSQKKELPLEHYYSPCSEIISITFLDLFEPFLDLPDYCKLLKPQFINIFLPQILLNVLANWKRILATHFIATSTLMASCSILPSTASSLPDMASSNSNQVNEKATMPSNQDWTEILKTPLTADFSHNFMDASVHFPEADMDSPPTKTVNPACRQENRVGHGNTMQSVENNVHEASMEDDDLDKPSGRPVQQFAMVRRSEEDPNGILSPSTLTPGFARKLDEMCPRSDSEDTPYALQQQHYYSSQTYGASNPAFHLSDTRRGPHRSHSAIQVSRDLYSISQHAHPSRQPQAPYFQYNGAERNSVTPQPDASRKSTTAAGLARQFRPAAAAAPTRALSQPIINARNQQSIEAVHEHQQSLAYRGPPPQVTAAQPEADTPKLLTFQSLGDAVASQTPRQNFNFNNDPTYPHDQQAVQKYVLQLYCAMYDMKEATDSIKIMESWQKALNKESKAVEVTCWILLVRSPRHCQR